MPTKEDLKILQSQDLDLKVMLTKQRIREWVTYYGNNGVYVSFSGGKDSTVLLHLVREIYPEVEAVFVNTGLEYPEIQSFVKSFENVTILYPKKTFKQVISDYGYPIISKNISHHIGIARNSPNGKIAQNYVNKPNTSKFSSYKYRELTKTDFKVSDICCNIMKKTPVHNYGKQTEKKAIIATMTEESQIREAIWLQTGCNAYDCKYQISKPMSFWREQDILQYIKENNIEIASVYGDITCYNGQLSFNNCGCKLCTSGCDRTGCIFCGFGCHLEKGEGRFERLKRTHPKQYDFCINGGAYDDKGIWKPDNKGLGMGHVFDVLNNLFGSDFIKY